MSKEQMIKNIIYLVDKYLPERTDLKNLIREKPGAVKHVLAEISTHRIMEYDENDLALIKDIVYYFV